MICLDVKCINGEFSICCASFLLPLLADVSGTWQVSVDFNGTRTTTSFTATDGQQLNIPVTSFNESYTHNVRLIRPDGTIYEDAVYQLVTMIGAGCGISLIPVTPTYAYWLAKDDNTPPTESELLAGTQVALTPGQTITYDLTGMVGDKWIFLAEPSTEPVKTRKYAAVTDDEVLGNDGQFNTRQIAGSLAYYPSNFPTSNTQFPIQLRVS